MIIYQTWRVFKPGTKTRRFRRPTALNFASVCSRGSHVCHRLNENTRRWYVKITGGPQVADTGTMLTRNWPCSQSSVDAAGKSWALFLGSSSLLSSWSVRTMDAKVVLITGCSSGIGLSLAVRLASDPQKAFKGNQGDRLLCWMEDGRPVISFSCVTFISSLCNHEKSVQKGTPFREC